MYVHRGRGRLRREAVLVEGPEREALEGARGLACVGLLLLLLLVLLLLLLLIVIVIVIVVVVLVVGARGLACVLHGPDVGVGRLDRVRRDLDVVSLLLLNRALSPCIVYHIMTAIIIIIIIEP